ncbi:unnamed protein product, partial [Didymodactylos carnosus]
ISSDIDTKPLVPEQLWHELLLRFLSDDEKYFNQDYQLIFHDEQRLSNDIMSQRYYDLIDEICPPQQKWTDVEYFQMHEMFDKLIKLAFEYSKRFESNDMAFLSEYLILALQLIG